MARLLSRRTRSYLLMDLRRLVARRNNLRSGLRPPSSFLHLGCGARRVARWLNVDVMRSDFDLDLAWGKLPWADGVFEAVVSQEVIEHLELKDELRPLLKEVARCAKPGAELWLSCPDMEKVCRAYTVDRGVSLLQDRRTRYPLALDGEQPPQQVVNVLFHQSGQHKNLFDFALLKWLLEGAGFASVEQVAEADLLARFPDFPPRNDDAVALYVRARKPA